MEKTNMNIFNKYITEIAKIKDETEHSGRTPLENLLKEFAREQSSKEKDTKGQIEIIHESRRDKQGRGAPDFKFLLDDIELGYLENKKIGENLDAVLKSDQIKKYKTLTDNLILTDYLQWIWIHDGNIIKRLRLCEQSDLNCSTIKLEQSKCNQLAELINNFLSQKVQSIGSVEVLAKRLASPSAYIKEGIQKELERQQQSESGQLYNIYDTFKENLMNDIKPDKFADAFTQILVYSLFIAKLNQPNERINIYTLQQNFPSQFDLLSDILKFFSGMERDERYIEIAPFIKRIIAMVNNIDTFAFGEELNVHHSKGTEKDPYVYFYEDFLTHYNKQIKEDRGVYYTPPPVVHYIIQNLNEVIKQEFGIEDGLGAIGVKVLDFACGTGTFMLELYKQVLQGVQQNAIGQGAKAKTGVIDHLLKEVFGFELMIPPYCIAHMRLSQFLIEEGFDFATKDKDGKKKRIPVYLTNTLENIVKANAINNKNNQQFEFASFIEAVAQEGEKAQEVKDDNQIFVIMGNPPYKGHSMNSNPYINQLLTGKDQKGNYKEDGYYHMGGKYIAETQMKWIQDDYVKFIRFAESKIEQNKNGGVIGIITPHNFLDNPTFRAMRYHLMKTFDKMYFLDLHGNARKKEKALDGTKDENVFDIMTGVAISILIKNPKTSNKTKTQNPLNCIIKRKDLYGNRKAKFAELYNNVSDYDWQTIEPTTPFYLFTEQNEKLREEYERGVSLSDVFEQSTNGIKTNRDNIAIQFTKEQLECVMKDFNNLSESEIRRKYKIKDKKPGGIQWIMGAIKNVRKNINKTRSYRRVDYRPFDARFTMYEGRENCFISRPRYDTMQHMINGDNVGLCFVRKIKTGINLGCFIAKDITDDALAGMSATCLAPLYLYQNNMGVIDKVINFKPDFIKMIESRFGKLATPSTHSPSGCGVGGAQTSSKTSDNPSRLCNTTTTDCSATTQEDGITPEQILAYIYAVLHSPSYRAKYLEFLKIDFPKIPFDVSFEEFKRLAGIGQELIDAHLMKKVPKLNIGQPRTDGVEDYIATKPEYKPNDKKLYFNKTCYFADVSPEVFNFKIGGYQVLDKYLKSRKGMDIFKDLAHITNIIKVLAFTVEKMGEVDDVYNRD